MYSDSKSNKEASITVNGNDKRINLTLFSSFASTVIFAIALHARTHTHQSHSLQLLLLCDLRIIGRFRLKSLALLPERHVAEFGRRKANDPAFFFFRRDDLLLRQRNKLQRFLFG